MDLQEFQRGLFFSATLKAKSVNTMCHHTPTLEQKLNHTGPLTGILLATGLSLHNPECKICVYPTLVMANQQLGSSPIINTHTHCSLWLGSEFYFMLLSGIASLNCLLYSNLLKIFILAASNFSKLYYQISEPLRHSLTTGIRLGGRSMSLVVWTKILFMHLKTKQALIKKNRNKVSCLLRM